MRPVADSQDPAGIVLVRGIADRRGARELDITQVQNIIVVEPGNRACEQRGLVQLQRAGGGGVKEDVLRQRAAEFERRQATDLYGSAAGDGAVDGHVSAVGPEQ